MKKGLPVPESKKRLHLLRTARLLFLQQGFIKISMNDLARVAGISKRTLYQYFSSRDALIDAAILHDYEIWNEWFFDAVSQRTDAGVDPLQAFHEVLQLCVDDPEFHGCLFAQATLAPAVLSDTTRETAASCTETLFHFFLVNLRRAGVQHVSAAARLQTIYVLALLAGVARGFSEHLETQLIRDARLYVGKQP